MKLTQSLFLLISSTLLAYVAGACQGESKSDLKIYGGSPSASTAWLSAVAVTDQNGIFCSGTAIHPRVVVTAAHCLDGSTYGLRVYYGAGTSGGSYQGQIRAVRSEYSPRYGYSDSGYNDIGYILLESDLPFKTSDFIPVLTDPQETAQLMKRGQDVTLVGFGYTDSQELGVKYETTTRITSLTDNEATMGGSGHDACQGDSGGPAYARLPNGEWRVFGVVSRGPDCGSGGQWGLMSANICWIQQRSGVELGLKGISCEKVDTTPAAPVYFPPESSSSSDNDDNGYYPVLDDGESNPYPGSYDYGDAYGGGYCLYFGDC